MAECHPFFERCSAAPILGEEVERMLCQSGSVPLWGE